MSNENTKKGKFNAIDAFIIFLVIVCLISIVYRAITVDSDAVNASLKEYRIYFKIDDIRSSSLPYFVTGDTIRLKTNNSTLGVLDGIVQHVPAVGAYNENGGEVLYPELEKHTIYNDTRYSLVGYITVRGEMTEQGFLLNGGTYISSNSVLSVVSEHIETNIRIISISEK